MRNAEETIGKMIDRAGVSFLSYVDEEGFPITKAMLKPRERSLVGTVEVLETDEAKEKLWKKGDTMYYKEGVTDPDYCVLKFTAKKGRYYSNFKSENFEV